MVYWGACKAGWLVGTLLGSSFSWDRSPRQEGGDILGEVDFWRS